MRKFQTVAHFPDEKEVKESRLFYEKSAREGHYVASVCCNNCRWTGQIQVPKGIRVSSFLMDFKCPTCELGGLVQTYRKP